MSGRKAFSLRIEIEVHSVQCSHIRLCHSESVALRLHMLSSTGVTTSAYPPFPIHFHEKLIFEKVIDYASTLSEIQDELDAELMTMELVTGKTEIVADFRTRLSNLLFPKNFADEDRVALVMEPTDKFAGATGPKVDVSTRITLEEVSRAIKVHDSCVRPGVRPNSTECLCRWRTRRRGDSWRDNISCDDCPICNSYSGYFDTKTCPCIRRWYTCKEVDKPTITRQLFYNNLDYFYRQLKEKKNKLNYR